MKTTLYLIRHGATVANLASPPRLQGRNHNPPLALLGVRQAEATRDFLAIRPIDRCFSSPLLRAVETAAIVAEPHGLRPVPLDALTECDVGRWEGMSWEAIQESEPEAYQRFMTNPAEHGYPGGESFGTVYRRVAVAMDEIVQAHPDQAVLIVGHHVVNRTYLAGVLGLGPNLARQVKLDNCGISIVTHDGSEAAVITLNAAFHLQGVAA